MKTIKEMRQKELERLVAFKTDSPTEKDFAEARKLMNSFYRLCGLAETNLYLANDERTCNLPSTAKSEEREEKWRKRLDKEFKKKYGLSLFYAGYAPSIGTVDEHWACSEKISRFFYR